MKVTILDGCDGFTLLVEKDGEKKRFYFNQEDTREGMINFFSYINVESEYEEDY